MSYCHACGGEGWLPSLPEGQSECPYCHGTGKGDQPVPRAKRYYKQGVRVYVTDDPADDLPLRRAGWRRTTRKEALDYLGGPTWAKRVIARCGKGEMKLWDKRWRNQSELDIECVGTITKDGGN